MVTYVACDLIPAIAPDDWPIIPQDTTGGIVDTIPTDTIIPIEVDTCEAYVEHTIPEFVTLYVKFDSPQSNVIWEGGQVQSSNLGDVLSVVAQNSFIYGSDNTGAWAIINGTNNHAQYQLKVFTRIDNAKWYMGTAKQAIIVPSANETRYKELINAYPSVNQFSFYGTNYDSLTYVDLCREVLKDCKAGRWYADLFFSPYEIPQTIIDSLDLAGWERIRE